MGEQSIAEAAKAALKAAGFQASDDDGGEDVWQKGNGAAIAIVHPRHVTFDIDVDLPDLSAFLRYKETVTERDALWETLQTKQAALTALGEENTCLTKEVERLAGELDIKELQLDSAVCAGLDLRKEVERLNKALDLVPELANAAEECGQYSEDDPYLAKPRERWNALEAEIAKLRGGGKSE